MSPTDLTLVVRRSIRAPAARLFEAWTTPDLLVRWWGPTGVRCAGAEVDLREGGRYRIGNRLDDGRVVDISGVFERIAPPNELIYSWRLGDSASSERVQVRFEPRGEVTEVIIVHQRVASVAAREEHERGWISCLEGLARFVGSGPRES